MDCQSSEVPSVRVEVKIELLNPTLSENSTLDNKSKLEKGEENFGPAFKHIKKEPEKRSNPNLGKILKKEDFVTIRECINTKTGKVDPSKFCFRFEYQEWKDSRQYKNS